MHIYNVWFLILLLLLFSLFDNYVGFRPFDAIGVLFLIGYTIFNLKNLKIDSSVLIITSIFTIIFIIPSILVGIIRYESPAGILVFIGVMVFLVISSISIDESKIKYLLSTVILFLSSAIILQFLLHMLTSSMPNFLLFDGGELRLNFADKLFRYSGLYIEPGSHALVIILLNSLYISINKKRDYTTHFSIASIFASMSLAGMLASFILYLLPINKLNIISIEFFKKIFYFTIIIALIIFLLYQNDNMRIVLFDRLENVLLGTDGSSEDRLMKFFRPQCQYFLFDNALGYIFVSGISSDFFVETCGSNNLSFSIFCFGYLGAFVMWSIIVYYLRNNTLVLFAFLYILFSGQLMGYMFFWFYLGLVVNYINLKKGLSV